MFALVDPRLLVVALSSLDSRPAKVLSIFVYGSVCANARGLQLDEFYDLEATYGTSADSRQLAAYRERAERNQYDASLRRSVLERALGEPVRDDLMLVVSPNVLDELSELALRLQRSGNSDVQPDVLRRLVVRFAGKAITRTPVLVTDETLPRRHHLVDGAIAAKAQMVITDDDELLSWSPNVDTEGAPRDTIRVVSLQGFVSEVLPTTALERINARAVLRGATSAPLRGRLPAELDVAGMVKEAASGSEIMQGARAANVDWRELDADVSEVRLLSGVRGELADFTVLDARLRLRVTASQERTNAGALPPILRLRVARWFSVRAKRSWLTEAELDLTAVEAERTASLERLRTAVLEQIRRQLRAAIEARAEKNYSTTLSVRRAPGLAHLTEDDFGIETSASTELAAIMSRMPGGSIGLAGRRGIGKTRLTSKRR